MISTTPDFLFVTIFYRCTFLTLSDSQSYISNHNNVAIKTLQPPSRDVTDQDLEYLGPFHTSNFGRAEFN